MINKTINWAEAEKQYYKERDWLIEVRTLCKHDTLTIRRMTIPDGTSKFDHYNNIVNEVWQRAQSIGATYFIIASNWLPILRFSDSFEIDVGIGAVHGSYTVGTFKGLSVIVSPTMDSFEMLCGADTTEPEYNIASIDSSKFILLKLED